MTERTPLQQTGEEFSSFSELNRETDELLKEKVERLMQEYDEYYLPSHLIAPIPETRNIELKGGEE